MLSYEEELELSDRLVARRPLVAESKDRELDATELEVVEQGDRAASTLVEEYIPFIRSIASRIYHSSGTRYVSGIEFDDLVNEGVKGAMSCTNAFNARGKDDKPGRRFSTYAEPMITKTIKRFVSGESTPISINVDRVQASMKWYAVKTELRTELGREPTDGEMHEKLPDIDTDYVVDIPTRHSMVNLDNPESNFDVESEEAASGQDEEYHTNTLTLALQRVGFNEDIVQTFVLYFGCDRGYPRDAVELAQDMGIGPRVAQRNINLVQDMLIHPQYRMVMKRFIEESGRLALDD